MRRTRFERSRGRVDRFNHALLLLFAALVVAACYRFATLLLGGLPWPVWLRA